VGKRGKVKCGKTGEGQEMVKGAGSRGIKGRGVKSGKKEEGKGW
jgi:hypothetical protein